MTGNLSYQQRIARRRDISEGHFRNPARRDRDRLRYTRYFRRLSGVTQVTHSEEAQLHHNRLTHSMKVAQVASALSRVFLIREDIDPSHTSGRRLREIDRPSEDSLATSLDPYVVEAAAHAHDIGHPPFGHRGETVLDDLVDAASEGEAGFEGNAQSFHVVTKLASRDAERGCNLTRATLNAMLKYPWDRTDEKALDDDGNPNKWGYYTDPGLPDQDAFRWTRQPLNEREKERVLEAQIMDWADDITYAVHDLQDFFRSGLIPLDELFREAIGEVGSNDSDIEQFALSSNEELSNFRDFLAEETSVDPTEFDVAQFFTDILEIFKGDRKVLVQSFSETDTERPELKKFTSMLVSRYMEAKRGMNPEHVKIVRSAGYYNLEIDPEYEAEVETLKALTRYYVISNPVLMQQQRGQEQILRNLYNDLMEEAESARGKTFPSSAIPSPYRERVKIASETDIPIYRIISDLISSLTEQQAISLHKRLRGWTPGSIQKDLTG